MKQFSKEYIEKYYPSGSKFDFSFEDYTVSMPINCMISVPCDGFGSTLLMKDMAGHCFLGFYINNYCANKQKDFIYWLPINYLLKQDPKEMLFGSPIEIQIN